LNIASACVECILNQASRVGETLHEDGATKAKLVERAKEMSASFSDQLVSGLIAERCPPFIFGEELLDFDVHAASAFGGDRIDSLSAARNDHVHNELFLSFIPCHGDSMTIIDSHTRRSSLSVGSRRP